MVTWAGALTALFGAAHTVGALTAERAATHADIWFSRGLLGESFQDMSPAHSAYWFSLDSFGIPLTLLGILLIWLDRRGIVPPVFLTWALATWWAVDAYVLAPTWNGLIPLGAVVLLVLGRRQGRHLTLGEQEPVPAAT